MDMMLDMDCGCFSALTKQLCIPGVSLTTWPTYVLASPNPEEQNHWAVSEMEIEKLHFKCAKIIRGKEFFSSSQLYKAV